MKNTPLRTDTSNFLEGRSETARRMPEQEPTPAFWEMIYHLLEAGHTLNLSHNGIEFEAVLGRGAEEIAWASTDLIDAITRAVDLRIIRAAVAAGALPQNVLDGGEQSI